MKAKKSEQGTDAQGPAEGCKYLARKAYREAMEELEEFLGFAFFRLDELKADLAVEGSHKKWADSQGAVLMLDKIDFGKSDDPVVRDLAALHAHLKEVYDRLPVGPSGAVPPRSPLH